MTKSSTIKAIRLLHRYAGLFFAPAILFFSFTGALQTFGWHETSRGSSYEPPSWLVRMAQLHKKQTLTIPAPKAKAPAAPAADTHDAPAPDKKPAAGNLSRFVLKCFVFAMSIGLILSTLLGIVMALLYGGDWRVVWAVVFAGAVLPAAILLL